MKVIVLFLLLVPFYEGQYEDGVHMFVGSPEQAAVELEKIDEWGSMPNGSKYAKLLRIDVVNLEIEEIGIPKIPSNWKSVLVTR